ncbi:MAG: phenylalanine--tRNA ligase subunit beta [Flavobacteriaceae bacterium]|jgi:phenylalanyl-tRNA synthetase beta chain|nr:phenylalanine--tRNA ligase subunit beta [Flavobacteriaceae bacterium]
MKISYNWLKQFIKIDWTAEKTSELLTDLGLEVEGLAPFQSIKGGLQGIVVGQVLTCEQHPNADRLKITTINIGTEDPLAIVCGAPNVAVGQKVAVATIGTTLYTTDGEAWTIKKGKIRGEESHGMLCAEDELGLGASHDGIMILNDSLEIGSALAKHYDIEDDLVFEIGLTPNRADAMSHFGTARDVMAGLSQHGINAKIISPSVTAFHVDNRSLKIDVVMEDKLRAPRYCGLTISNVTVKDSPKWLQNRLKSIGLSPINNVVDATNYVLHDLGQPLHAFDADRISGKKIIVKTLEAGTKFITLDGVERTLHKDDLMICDTEKPLCIAGVFGGKNSGVSNETNSIFLEAAYFNPVSIRKTAKRHALNTDASFRFERGIDPNITKYALKRAALLITEIAGGKISSDLIDEYPNKIEDSQVFLSFENTNKLIGEELPKETIKGILSALEIKVNNITESGLGLTIPAYRNDVQREVDVIEEILRVYGYNNIGITNKLNASISNTSKFESYKIENIIANQLVGHGFYEIMSNSLTTDNYTTFSEQLKPAHDVQILNPLSTDLSVMRQSLIFSGLEAIAFNINRQQSDLKLFEFGKTYHNFEANKEEHNHLTVFVTGNKAEKRWNSEETNVDYFYLKGLVTAVFERLGIQKLKTSPLSNDVFSEGQQLSVGKNSVVEFGSLKPAVLKSFGISQSVFCANFNWDNLLKVINQQAIKFKSISKYPEVKRDFSLLINEDITFETLYKLAKQTENNFLKDINLFDVYTGDKLAKGKKSYAISFTLQDKNKTLNDVQIDKIMSKIQKRFESELGAELR